MIKNPKHYKASKQKKSKSFLSNIALHPFVVIAILSALAIVVFLITAYYFWYLK